MRKIALLAAALALSGCAALHTIENVYTYASTATVQPQTIIVAANAFDAAEATATQWLLYCRAHQGACAKETRRTVIRAVRSGRAARNQLETYLSQSIPAPGAIYNTLVVAINQLNASNLRSQ